MNNTLTVFTTYFSLQKTIENSPDLVAIYVDYLKTVNPANVGHFISSYIKYVKERILFQICLLFNDLRLLYVSLRLFVTRAEDVTENC